MANGALIRNVVGGLASYLASRLPELKAVRQFWPGPNEQIAIPSAAVIQRGDILVEHHPPFELPALRGAVVTLDGGQKRIDTAMVTARYEIPLMLHFFTASLEARETLRERAMNALNPNLGSGGLMLSLPQYFDAAVRFTTERQATSDNEESAQRNEWRLMLAVTADGNSIVARSQGVILEGEFTTNFAPGQTGV